MKKLRLSYPIPFLFRMLDVSPGYYAWSSRLPSRHSQDKVKLEIEIQETHKRTRHTCGPERLQKDLAAHGITVVICRIGKIR